MANEVTPVEGPYEQHDFTVNNLVGIEQHTLLFLSDPRTASGAGGAEGGAFAGIAATEKVASNGKTELGCYTSGIFVMTTGGSSVSAGAMVASSGANLIAPATAANILTGSVIGVALEDIAGSTTGEVKVGGN